MEIPSKTNTKQVFIDLLLSEKHLLHFYSKECKQGFLIHSNKMVADLGWISDRLRTGWGCYRTTNQSNRSFFNEWRKIHSFLFDFS